MDSVPGLDNMLGSMMGGLGGLGGGGGDGPTGRPMGIPGGAAGISNVMNLVSNMAGGDNMSIEEKINLEYEKSKR